MKSRPLMRRFKYFLVALLPIFSLGIHNPQSSFAAPSVSLPSTFVATTTFANVNSGGALTVAGYDAAISVQVTVSVNSGFVKITTTSGLTAPRDYSSGAWTADTSVSIAFYGTQANVSSALNSLQYKASSVGSNATISIATFPYGAAYDGSTGHSYEIVTSTTVVTWELARCKALYSNSNVYFSGGTSTMNTTGCTTGNLATDPLVRRTQGGLRGYLANITTAAEQQFIKGKLSSVGWIGGADTDSEGTFIWMDGPEKGEVFWNSNSLTRRSTNTVTGSIAGFSYGSNRFNYFSTGEPNDASGEDFVEFGYGSEGTIGASWNDCQNGCNRYKYVIEYGETGDVLSGASGTIAVTTKPILSSSPSISGTPRYGSLLTSSTGSWGNSPTSFTYQWSSASTSGGSYVAISGASTATYTPTGSEVGRYLKVAVTAINASGATVDTSTATSEIQTAPITIAAGNKSVVYSGSSASGVTSFSITSGSLIGSDTFTALTYTFTSASPTYNSTTAPKNAGIYTVTPSSASFSVGASSYYSISYTTATLTITKADTVTVTMDSITAVTYTGNPAVLNTRVNFSGLKGTDSATVELDYSGSSIPTNAGTYSAIPVNFNFVSPAMISNYQAVSITGETFTINKANQSKLSIGQYTAFTGISTYPINVYGGSGTGALSRSLVDSGTAQCELENGFFVQAKKVGQCSVSALKAGDSNYFAETTTATLYWIQWSDAYATRVPSGPTEIVLSHKTQITKYNFETLTVTSYQNGSGGSVTQIAPNAQLRIIGDGFDPTDSTTEVVFGNAEIVDMNYSIPALQIVSDGSGGYYLLVTVPSAATTDVVLVNSRKGTAAGPVLTIAP